MVTRVRKISRINLNYAKLVGKKAFMNVAQCYFQVGKKRCVATASAYSKSGEAEGIMENNKKALEVIEGMILATEPDNNMLEACYRFAHVGLRKCDVHHDWEEELEEMYKKLKTGEVI